MHFPSSLSIYLIYSEGFHLNLATLWPQISEWGLHKHKGAHYATRTTKRNNLFTVTYFPQYYNATISTNRHDQLRCYWILFVCVSLCMVEGCCHRRDVSVSLTHGAFMVPLIAPPPCAQHEATCCLRSSPCCTFGRAGTIMTVTRISWPGHRVSTHGIHLWKQITRVQEKCHTHQHTHACTYAQTKLELLIHTNHSVC